MTGTNNQTTILNEIEKKYEALHLNPSTQLEGLLYSKPITYWDYLNTDALLNLQIQRTTLPDEMVFIMYHQVNELIFKMVLWETKQLFEQNQPSLLFFTEKIERISRYFDMLTNSFSIMENGMNVTQYMQFRNTLTPASGFQSAQYRLIEFSCTDVINLMDARYRSTNSTSLKPEQAFEKLYWQAAGKDHSTGQKSHTLLAFEKKYKALFLQKIEFSSTKNIWHLFQQFSKEEQNNPSLIAAMRHLDYTINIKWVLQHLNVAIKYIEQSDLGNGEATGGSDWKKYLHPKHQKRIFFPDLWSSEEHKNWGIES